jgi:hypothetical protein
MAQSTENILTRGLSGTIGDLITFRQLFGKTIVGKRAAPSAVPPTEKATAVRVKFKRCSAYAKTAARDPVTGPQYKALAREGITAYNVALADAYHAPEVIDIDALNYHGRINDTITVRAKDDFKVVSVLVSIYDMESSLVEEGYARQQGNERDWLYISTRENTVLTGSKIRAIAKDLPGNIGSLEITIDG